MQIKGTIKLINIIDETLQIQKYTGRVERNFIIQKWSKLYGEMFSRLFLQILPDTDVRDKYLPNEKDFDYGKVNKQRYIPNLKEL